MEISFDPSVVLARFGILPLPREEPAVAAAAITAYYGDGEVNDASTNKERPWEDRLIV